MTGFGTGTQSDNVTFSPESRYMLTANLGGPCDDYSVDLGSWGSMARQFAINWVNYALSVANQSSTSSHLNIVNYVELSCNLAWTEVWGLATPGMRTTLHWSGLLFLVTQLALFFEEGVAAEDAGSASSFGATRLSINALRDIRFAILEIYHRYEIFSSQ